MLDLYRLLAEQPLIVLSAIAESWRVTLDEADPIRAAETLGDAMLTPGALEGRLSRLSPEAQEALEGLRRPDDLLRGRWLGRGLLAVHTAALGCGRGCADPRGGWGARDRPAGASLVAAAAPLAVHQRVPARGVIGA